jgi:broad specificity phosphatase PhoE
VQAEQKQRQKNKQKPVGAVGMSPPQSKDSSIESSSSPPPLLLYIRHGDDHHDARHEARYPKHDHPLNREGKARAARMARDFVERYGAPTAVYCSPFKRARQTADIMMSALDESDRARITIDPGLSRYFSRREQRQPSVGADTHRAGPPPIRERNGAFGRRCKRQYERVVERHFFSRDQDKRGDRPPVIWCITHALVMRRVAERVRVAVPEDHVPFLGWFVARARSSRPSMKGLTEHGLGRACPERALARSWGIKRRRSSNAREHKRKDDEPRSARRKRHLAIEPVTKALERGRVRSQERKPKHAPESRRRRRRDVPHIRFGLKEPRQGRPPRLER